MTRALRPVALALWCWEQQWPQVWGGTHPEAAPRAGDGLRVPVEVQWDLFFTLQTGMCDEVTSR